MTAKLYFVTKNSYKIGELFDYVAYRDVDSRLDVEFCVFEYSLQEILHRDLEAVVKKKTVEAYEHLGLPCFVEQGGLFFDALPGLPGTVGQVVWDAVGDRMCGFLRDNDSRTAVATSLIGYCDGKQVHLFPGETRGQVAERSRGDYKFQWDPIFIPEGSDQTYGELGLAAKRHTSPTVKALDKFLNSEFADAARP